MTVEAENAKEEARELVEDCTKCGRCKANSPEFKVMREEHYSPRGMITLIENNHFDKILYSYTLSRACEHKCPLKIRFSDAVIKARKVLIEQKKELPENKEMIKNLHKTGNIFGIKN
jgi:Fe-S oxidoreductase